MDMRMMLKLLVPGVQYAEEADISAQMLRIGRNLQQRLRAAAKQHAVHHLLVLQCERRQLVGEREYNMRVGDGKQFSAPRRQPSIARLALALRAVPVAARVIGNGLIAAGETSVQMAAHRGSATSLDRAEYFKVQPGKPKRRMIDQSVTRYGYNFGQLQEWPAHLFFGALRPRWRPESKRIERAGSAPEMPLRQMQVAAGRLQIGMPHEQLNGA
jgi:hypothetical protein